MIGKYLDCPRVEGGRDMERSPVIETLAPMCLLQKALIEEPAKYSVKYWLLNGYLESRRFETQVVDLRAWSTVCRSFVIKEQLGNI